MVNIRTQKSLPETLGSGKHGATGKEILTILKLKWMVWRESERCAPGILTKVTETLLPLAQERHITVHSQLAEDVIVSGNISLLEKAIHNILSNAIRHSPEGSEVLIHLTTSALSVTNTGTSIPEEDLSVLFTPFYRVEKSRNKSTGGNGLGLFSSRPYWNCIVSIGWKNGV
ncbi:MAG: sensor histidine kinase [Hydrogeniiclostridium mannosilyticum]